MNELKVLNVEELNMRSQFEVAKATLTEVLKDDASLVVTEETLDVCKRRVTELNKLSKNINDRKIQVKKEASVDIVKFEDGCKELIGMVEKVSENIKKGTIVFEENRKSEKKAKCLEFIQEAIAGHALNSKYSTQISVTDTWLNVSTTLKTIQAEIADKCTFLKQSQDREVQNREAILNHIGQVGEMLELSVPLTENDFQQFLRNTETVNLPEAMAEISRVAKARKDAEVAAVEKARAIEIARIEKEQERIKKVEADRIAKEIADAKAIEEYTSKIVRERKEKEEMRTFESFPAFVPIEEIENDFEIFEPIQEAPFEPIAERKMITVVVEYEVYDDQVETLKNELRIVCFKYSELGVK